MLRALDVTYLLDDKEYARLCQITEGYRQFGLEKTPEEIFGAIMGKAYASIDRVFSDNEKTLEILRKTI